MQIYFPDCWFMVAKFSKIFLCNPCNYGIKCAARTSKFQRHETLYHCNENSFDENAGVGIGILNASLVKQFAIQLWIFVQFRSV